MTAPDADARLQALERQVAELAAEVRRLRERERERTDPPSFDAAGDPLGAMRARGAPPRSEHATPPPPRPHRPAAPRIPIPHLDVEALVGRYGTLLLGALTVLLGVGAFLSWAIQRVSIGPELRVGLGALAAAGVAALGLWLRRRGTRRFGTVLLALALALVHVVAWGAGPTLGVVPPAVALALAALASAALAALAWRDGDQPLFVVGVGGALLAPFVTAGESGDPLALLLYGLVVLASAAAALRDRAWRWAVGLLAAATLLYAGVALDATTPQWTDGLAGARDWLRRDAPALFVLLAAWAVLLLAGRAHRSSLARRLLVVLVVPLVWRATTIVGGATYWDLVAIALAGVATLYVALRLRDAAQPWARTSAALQPLLLAAGALAAVPTPANDTTALVAAAFALLALLAAASEGAVPALAAPAARADDATTAAAARSPREADDPLWAVHVAVAVLLVALAAVILLRDAPVASVAALAALAAGSAWLARRGRVLAPFVPAVVTLAGALLRAADLLDARPAFEYVPFLTPASLAALCAVLAAWAVGRLAAAHLDARAAQERAILRALGPAAAFGWGWLELARAISPDVAAFLVIAYLAVVGVGLILLGRRRGLPGGRRIGLGLAILAALMAIGEASDFASVGLRVGSYLLVGGFLLAVAYWYRAAGDPEPPADGAATSAVAAEDAR